MTRIAVFIVLVLISINAAFIIYAHQLDDEIKDFTLMNVDGKPVSLSDYEHNRGVVVIFTSNRCPYSKAYEDRIIAWHNQHSDTYPVIAINSNNGEINPEESFDAMKKRAHRKNYRFAYLKDDSKKVARIFGAVKTPQVYLISRQEDRNVIKYVGAMDDSFLEASQVKHQYLDDAAKALEEGREIPVKATKTIGCSIK